MGKPLASLSEWAQRYAEEDTIEGEVVDVPPRIVKIADTAQRQWQACLKIVAGFIIANAGLVAFPLGVIAVPFGFWLMFAGIRQARR